MLSNRSRQLVDGIGAKRAALCLAQSTMQLRAAVPADAELLFEWRNHPVTRAVSRNSCPIDRTAHEQWFARTLSDASRCLRIAHIGPVDVGMIRFDLNERERTAEVSLYLDPALHGLGLGSTMLAAGESCVLAGDWPVSTFVAEVLPGNLPSQRLFEQGDYRFEGCVAHKSVLRQLTE
jgi:RimJ/RimL family protein N-acetyltransferase